MSMSTPGPRLGVQIVPWGFEHIRSQDGTGRRIV